MTPRPPIAVRAATIADRAIVAAVLARAFIADPALGYIFPDVASRPRRLRAFFDLIVRSESDPGDWCFAAEAVPAGSGVPADAAAVTIWRKPGAWKTPPSAMLRLIVPLIATFGTALPRALRLQGLLEANHPAAPHWYLEFAGCDPARHGRGFGGAAIRARLAATDTIGMPTALETGNEANLAIYAALGFRVTGDFAVTPDLHFWTMWRDPA
jgi:RimJ/RimL family protein N-acetyltransferase